jgi:magnesium/cobalt transport protein CorA
MAELRLQTSAGGRLSKEAFSLASLHQSVAGQGLAWLDIVNPDEEIRDFLLDDCGFDELAVEDTSGHTANTVQKFDNHRFVVIQARDDDKNRLDTEPVAIFLQEKLMITVRHTKIPALKVFSKRLLRADEEDLEIGVDYLLYEILDSIADDWAIRLAGYSDELDTLEFRVFDPSTLYENMLEDLHLLKQRLREVSKSVESLHSACIRLLRPGERLVNEKSITHFTDLQNLVTTLVKRTNNYSLGATSTRDTYLTNANLKLAESNKRLTEVMTTLTIIGAIMLPLTLIAGIFGMNTDLPFDASTRSGFWVIMAMMIAFGLTMITYFWRRGWFREPGE